MERLYFGLLLTMLIVCIMAPSVDPIVASSGKSPVRDGKSIESSTSSTLSDLPPIQWNKTYGETGLDIVQCVIETNDGGYALAGNGSAKFLKTDVSGNMQWNKTYDGMIYSAIQTSDGGYALAGYGSPFGLLIKIDSAGKTQWEKTYQHTAGKYCRFYCVVQTWDGGYALAGTSLAGTSYLDFVLFKMDSEGDVQWAKTYDRGQDETAKSLVQTSDGGYMLAGSEGISVYPHGCWLIKTDANGNVEWNHVYGGAGYDIVESVIQTSGGGYAFVGYTENVGDDDFWLVKTDAAGEVMWNLAYGSVLVEWGYSVIETADEGYLMAGTKFTPFKNDAYLIKINSSGDKMWEHIYGETGGSYAFSIRQTGDCGYIVAGTTVSSLIVPPPGEGDFWLMKLAREEGVDVHNVAVTRVWPYKTIVGEGFGANFSIAVGNRGTDDEVFNVTAYANATAIGAFISVTLPTGNFTTLTLTWNTTGFAKGNYVILGSAEPVLGETFLIDNNKTDGWFVVAMVGDITSLEGWPDGKVDMRDVGYVARRFQVLPPSSFWDPNADVNSDGKIDMKDIGTVARHFGEVDP